MCVAGCWFIRVLLRTVLYYSGLVGSYLLCMKAEFLQFVDWLFFEEARSVEILLVHL